MTAADVAGRVAALVDALTASGDLTEDRWREALHAVPRHLFVPDVAWAAPGDRDGYRIDRTIEPDGWMPRRTPTIRSSSSWMTAPIPISDGHHLANWPQP
jgi:hypothetical protein